MMDNDVLQEIVKWFALNHDGPATDERQLLNDAADEIERLRASVHPRVWKLVEKQRDFIVIGEHEPYYMQAYALIRSNELSKGTWTEEDRIAFMAAQLKGDE